MTRFWLFLLCGAAALFSTAISSSAQCVSLTTLGTPATQNFDTLANSGTSSTLPGGWYISESGTNANVTYTAGTGSGNTGDSYSFGGSGSSERALGGLLSGSLTPTIGACFTNDTGSTLTALDIAYTGEQWRLGATGRTDRIDFQYSLDATSLTTGAWTDVDALDFNGPQSSGTVGALDGNAAANRTAVSSSIGSLSIANGATVWIRWNDFNASGADDGLAVDDFSLTPQTTPPPPPPISIDDVTQFEGNSGTTSFTFTVSLGSPAPAGGVTFDIATADGTATTADNDYVQKSLTGQTIPAGSSTYDFTVVVNGDHVVESDETFLVNITNVTGATVGDGQGLGTIQNEDSTFQLQSATLSTTEGSTFTFTITRTGYTGAAASVNIHTVSGTATGSVSGCGGAGIDYGTPPASGINFAIGDTSKTFSVFICDDPETESDETFQGEIFSPTGATLGTPTSETVTILAPTASNAAIEGRVRTASGLGIRNATVVISGDGLDSPRTVRTGSFGYFRFDDLPVGETYVISVVSPRHVFANPTRLITLDDNVIGLEFQSLQ